jgi:hypothetical protein
VSSQTEPGHPEPAGFDAPAVTVQGPVQVEILAVVLDDDGSLGLTGPCAAEPWYAEVADDEDPMQVVTRLVRANVGEPYVVHSTSWRRARGGVVLSFVAVLPPETVGSLARTPIERAELARGGATTAPARVDAGPVIEHGLRHLAWLVRDDPAVAEALPPPWHDLLRGYVPEPFRHL